MQIHINGCKLHQRTLKTHRKQQDVKTKELLLETLFSKMLLYMSTNRAESKLIGF